MFPLISANERCNPVTQMAWSGMIKVVPAVLFPFDLPYDGEHQMLGLLRLAQRGDRAFVKIRGYPTHALSHAPRSHGPPYTRRHDARASARRRAGLER